MILAALAAEAGLPDGVVNIVHGTHEIVNHICDDDDIKAISFDGANNDGMHIYARAAARGKRVQFIPGGKKNHAIIMPDASADATLDALVAASFGAGGQRCMTLSTAIFVGGSAPWEQELVERAQALEVNAGTEIGADIGPVISEEAKDQICRLVQTGVESGARLVLDGRNIVVPQCERGFFVGPTILCDVRTSMDCYKDEMFGPVLLCMQVDSLEDAIAIVNRSKYRSGASIFTTSGIVARKFQSEVEAELVGINVPVPIPFPFSSSNGSRASFAGGLSFCGKAGVEFYTQTKTVAQLWKDLPSRRVSSNFRPTSETEISSRGISLLHPPTSESDLPSREASPFMPSTSDNHPQSQNVSLPIPQTSDEDLPNLEFLPSMPPITERELFVQEGPASNTYIANQELSVSTSLSTQGNSMRHIFSQWVDDIVPKVGAIDALEVSTSDRSSAHRLCSTVSAVPMSLNSGSLGSVSMRYDMQRANINMQPTHETEVHIPLMSHQNENIHQTSDSLYMSYETNVVPPLMTNAMARNSEKNYVCTGILRNDYTLSTSERVVSPSNFSRNVSSDEFHYKGVQKPSQH